VVPFSSNRSLGRSLPVSSLRSKTIKAARPGQSNISSGPGCGPNGGIGGNRQVPTVSRSCDGRQVILGEARRRSADRRT